MTSPAGGFEPKSTAPLGIQPVAMGSSLRLHWREYLCELTCLATFMLSAAAFATLLQHPDSPWALPMPSTAATRFPMGLAMGLTAMAIVYSPVGRRSGAHMNPAITLTFLRLGKIARPDAAWYVLAQFAGGVGGIVLATRLLANRPADPAVNFVVTEPGVAGVALALVAEAAISFGMMSLVLALSNHPRLHRLTGIGAGLLVCAYITFEAPLSGMSMNPARSLGPALLAGSLDSLWIYFVAPVAGMGLAAVVYTRRHGAGSVLCAKFDHPAEGPCIFRCRKGTAPAPAPARIVSASEVSA
jgi:aquaporin Z